jgi:hypothetical protein
MGRRSGTLAKHSCSWARRIGAWVMTASAPPRPRSRIGSASPRRPKTARCNCILARCSFTLARHGYTPNQKGTTRSRRRPKLEGAAAHWQGAAAPARRQIGPIGDVRLPLHPAQGAAIQWILCFAQHAKHHQALPDPGSEQLSGTDEACEGREIDNTHEPKHRNTQDNHHWS